MIYNLDNELRPRSFSKYDNISTEFFVVLVTSDFCKPWADKRDNDELSRRVRELPVIGEEDHPIALVQRYSGGEECGMINTEVVKTTDR